MVRSKVGSGSRGGSRSTKKKSKSTPSRGGGSSSRKFDSSTPVASAVGGGFITAGGQVVRGSPDIQARPGTSFGGRSSNNLAAQRAREENARRQREAVLAKLKLQTARESRESAIKRSRAAALKEARVTAKRGRRVSLSRGERSSLIAREALRKEAIRRGQGFTKLERKKFLKSRGGSISELRSATRKGFKIDAEEVKKEIKAVTVPKQITFKVDKSAVERLVNQPTSVKDFGTISNINQTIKKDLKSGIISSKLLNIADIVSGGALTEIKINKDQSSLNSRVSKFNLKFGGRELSESEFKKANAEQNFIDSEQGRIDKRTDNLANSKRDSINDFFAKLSIDKTPRLTVKQQNQIQQAKSEDKKLQALIKSSKPRIVKLQSKIDTNQKQIDKLSKIKNKSILQDLKLFRLKNKTNTLRSNKAILETGKVKIVAGTFPIIPAAIPSGITKIKFVGKQKVDKSGKIVTDIFFETNKGRVGIAKGVKGSVEEGGKVVEVVLGRSGKIAVSLPTGSAKIIGTQTFVGVESVSSKSKALNIVVQLAKNGEVSSSKAKKLRQAIKNLFKADANKISIKNAKALQSKIQKAKTVKSIDLKRNLARLKKRGLVSIRRVRSGIGKTTRGRRPILKPAKAPKLSFKKIAKRAAKAEKVFDKISKKDFIKRIKSFRTTGDITAIQERRFLKRIKRLSKKGDIPKIEFLKIARNISPPKDLRKLPKLSFDTRLQPLDFQKNLARLRRKGQVPFKKSKVGKKTFRKPAKPADKKLTSIDPAANLRRLRKQNKFIKSARESAREPNFNKIVSRLKKQERSKRNKDNLKTVSNNLKILEQRGVGKSFSVKGKKIFRPQIKFPSGKVTKKLVKPISKDEFASISSVLTKGDLSLIVGKTITRAKDKAEFIGIITGAKKVSDSSTGSLQVKQQFSKALEKVLQKTAGAIAKAEKTSPVTKAAKIATATAFLSKASLSGSQKAIVKQVSAKASQVRSTVTQSTLAPERTKIIQKSISKLSLQQKSVQKSISRQKSRSAQLAKQKSKSAQAAKQKIDQRVAQLQKSKVALRFKKKLLTKQITRAPTITVPKTIRLFVPPRFKKKKFKGIVIKKKKNGAFDVFARPVKGKKLIKVNKVPLSKVKAQDLRNFVIDTSLSARGRIKATKGKPKTPKIKVPTGFAKRTSIKFRRTRSVKKKRIALPRGAVIERRGKRLDTRGEIRKISLAKRIRQLSPKKKKAVKRKVIKKAKPNGISPERRAQLIEQLKRARIQKARNALANRQLTSQQRTKLRRIISTI